MRRRRFHLFRLPLIYLTRGIKFNAFFIKIFAKFEILPFLSCRNTKMACQAGFLLYPNASPARYSLMPPGISDNCPLPPAGRCSKEIGFPDRNGCRGHERTGHWSASVATPPQQSTHFALMAFSKVRVLFFSVII